MSVLIKGMEMPTNTDMAPTAVWVYPNGHAIVFKDNGKMKQYTEVVPVPPHGRLIDADEFLKRAIGTKCFRGDYALMLEELVGESTTIIPAESPKEET